MTESQPPLMQVDRWMGWMDWMRQNEIELDRTRQNWMKLYRQNQIDTLRQIELDTQNQIDKQIDGQIDKGVSIGLSSSSTTLTSSQWFSNGPRSLYRSTGRKNNASHVKILHDFPRLNPRFLLVTPPGFRGLPICGTRGTGKAGLFQFRIQLPQDCEAELNLFRLRQGQGILSDQQMNENEVSILGA